MTNEGGENVNLSKEDLKKAKKFLEKSLKVVTKKGKEDPNSPSDDEQTKNFRKKFLEGYQKNPSQESWGQLPPPAAQGVPPIELNPEEISKKLNNVFKKRKEAAAQAEPAEEGAEEGIVEKEINVEPPKYKPSAEVTSFRKAIEKYRDSAPTPESEAEYWQARWGYYGAKVGPKIEVPKCDRTMEELIELEEKGRKLIYVPPQLSTPEGLDLLNKMHPMLRLDTENIINEKNVSGWIDVEVSPRVPNRGTTQIGLQKKFEDDRKMGMNLNVYIISSIESKDREGKYFDEQTWARLSSSRSGRRVDAGFKPDGSIHIDMPSPETTNLFLGGRSMGVKK